jgi:hypothetical protein
VQTLVQNPPQLGPHSQVSCCSGQVHQGRANQTGHGGITGRRADSHQWPLSRAMGALR